MTSAGSASGGVPDWLAAADRDAPWESLRVVVAGLGVSGFAAADALQHLGARVTVLADRADADSEEKATLLEILGVTVRVGAGATSELPPETQLVVTSPGIPPHAPIFARAAGHDLPVWGEPELAWRLRELLHAHGADELAFDSIVASGANGALPHAHPTDHIVEPRTLVTVDWGVRVDGYCSDCTRTFSTGSPPDRLREAYDVCLAAQISACDGIRAGITGVEADALAREPIEAAGFGGNFGHGLGHGVGVQVHEAPRLSTESTDTLEVGHIVTIEPGIYLPRLGGVRIEDLAVVREDGVELLTSFPKELIEVS